MLGKIKFTAFTVVIPVKNLDKNKEVPASVIVNRLLNQLSNIKTCEYGYLLAVTELINIGHADNKLSQYILFPVDFYCQTFKPVDGEVMTATVHKINHHGIFLKSGPMNMVFLSAQLIPDYHYVLGENPSFIRDDDLSKIEIGVVLRYIVYAVRWIEDEQREFRVLASINADGLGPVSLNGLDGLDL